MIEIRVDFFSGDRMRCTIRLDGKLGDAATIVRDEALAVFAPVWLFQKTADNERCNGCNRMRD